MELSCWLLHIAEQRCHALAMKLFLTSQLTALAPPPHFLIEGELQYGDTGVDSFPKLPVPLDSLFLIIFFLTDVNTAADLKAGTALIKIVFLK